ncbi:hypothetical protein QCA50_005643 [Cerrena zonata]|uniref:BTB domain-containing protein n=1 Tax=Cerrena zonata TaxID=2478898 RepID=A0AAW0GH84_9APHY
MTTSSKSQRRPEKASPENPPKKRKRLSNALAENKFRAEEVGLWFTDGNIIIVGGSTPFKVHRSVLFQRSSVLKDMFSLPSDESELMEGLPVEYLPESRSDLMYMLLGMYYGQKYLGHKKVVEFTMLSALLRLGTKYKITELREEAVARLRVCFPRRLGSFINSLSMRNDAGFSCVPDVIAMGISDVLEVINLARAHDIPDILPPAFYICSTLSPVQMVPVKTWDDDPPTLLSPKDLRRLLRGKDSLIQEDNDFMLLLRTEFRPNLKSCKQLCHRRFNAAFNSNPESLPDAGTFLVQNFWVNEVLPDKDFCVDCIEDMVEEVNRHRREIWSNLGKTFDCGPWPLPDDVDLEEESDTQS